MTIPVFFICFIVFILWFRVKSKQNKNDTSWDDDFWTRELEADYSRKKDLSDIEYLKFPSDVLPFHSSPTPEEKDYQDTVLAFSEKQLLNLSMYSNTDLKLQYGRANFDFLAQCDQNYLLFIRALDRWGNYLYEQKDFSRSKQILEYALSIDSDISTTYTNLARIYLSENALDKTQELIQRVEATNTPMKNSIVERIETLLQQY